jgi:hypothetical protein
VKIIDAIREFILYKQSLGTSYKNRALKLNAFARCAENARTSVIDCIGADASAATWMETTVPSQCDDPSTLHGM